MAAEFRVERNAGHPWDGRPGFDLMFVDADTPEELEALARDARRRFWEPWLLGRHDATGRPGGVLYKPSGIRAPWADSPDSPYPQGQREPRLAR